MKSMHQRLLQWLLLGIVATSSVIGVLIYHHAHSEIDELYNAHMEQLATMLVRQLDVASAHRVATASDIAGTGRWGEENYLIQIWDRAGHLRSSDIPVAGLPGDAVPLQATPGLHRRRLMGQSWRIYRADSDDLTVQIAQPETARQGIVAEVSLRLLLPLLLQIPLLALLAWVTVRRGLRPLGQLSAAIAQRQPHALQPLQTASLPPDLLPLASTLNDLLIRLDHAIQQQRHFVADAAHELRTPVAALQLQLDLLQRATTGEERDQAIAELHSGVQRATHLIQQLLKIARSETEPAPERGVDLQDAGTQALERHLPLARARDLDLGVTRLEPLQLPAARIDVDTVLDNLLANAVRFTPAGGRIDLALYRQDERVVFEVTDTGPGIPPGERNRIFDRFYRVLAVTDGETPPEGTGLGLAIVKAVCARNGADIDVSSGDDGHGARFRIYWPL